ncbi:MAG: type V CRISPR-associated endonuclease Cas1 [Candidatus Woesearchaeota archaeon]
MLTRPDFMKKQVLFIESDNSKKLKFKNSNLVLVDENDKIILQDTCHKIFVVFVYGETSITSVLIKNAKKFGITIVFLNYNLKTYFSINPENIGNFLLRKKQYNNEKELDLAKFIVKNKILNQKRLISELRYKGNEEKEAIKKLESLFEKIDSVSDNNELMSFEGNASKVFFSVYFKNLPFSGRKPRIKTDIFNLLLDIGYNFLFNFIEANLVCYGFDVYCGFYHKFFFQRKSLVCDLIEPFRCIIDKRIRLSYNLKQIDEKDFGFKNGQYFLKYDFIKKYSRIFLKEILEYKEDIFLFIQCFYRNFMKNNSIDKFEFFLIGEKK